MSTEFLNENSYRRYPFVDDSQMVLDDLTVPDNLLLDFQVVVTDTTYVAGAPSLLRVSTTDTEVTLEFAVGNLGFTVTVPAVLATPGYVRGETEALRYSLVFGDGVATLFAANPGYEMNYFGVIPLNPTLVVVANNCVNSVTSAAPYSDQLTGIVLLKPGYNCEPSVTDAGIYLLAAPGAGAGPYCGGSEDVVPCSQAWLWFNGQNASEDGNVVIEAGTGVAITNDIANHIITFAVAKTVTNNSCK